VYGGGVQDLQGCVAKAIATSESKILSFALKNENTFNLTIGIEFKASTMQDSITQILVNSDVFIALPGGILSLQQVMSILFWADGNFHRKPLGFLNVNGFFDSFLSYLNYAVEQKFIFQAT